MASVADLTRPCPIDGNSDMYGLGIRIGFYLQWYGALLAAWIAPGEAPALRLTNVLFTAAVFLATVIQTMEPAEIYIILLLNFGSSLYLIPVFAWRFATGFDPKWDPTRFPQSKPPSTMFNRMRTILLIAVMSYQIWFWLTQVPLLNTKQCVSYGFIFHKIPLNQHWFWLANLIITAVLLAVLALVFVLMIFRGHKPGKNDDDDWDNMLVHLCLIYINLKN
jgi:hypothetical protein